MIRKNRDKRALNDRGNTFSRTEEIELSAEFHDLFLKRYFISKNY